MATVNVTLPDGSVREYEAGVTLEEIAGSISRSLLKAAVAGKIDGRLVDLYTPVHEDAQRGDRDAGASGRAGVYRHT